MLQHIKTYSTYRFFTLYYMLFNRKQHKITSIGYYPIFMILNYIKYHESYELVKKIYYCNAMKKFYDVANYKYVDDMLYKLSQVPGEITYNHIIFEDNVEIDCNTVVGVSIKYVNDPINTLILMVKREGPLNYIYAFAASLGHFECMKYFCHLRSVKLDNLACMEAAAGGHLQCLQYLHNIGCEWSGHHITLNAAANGHLKCLKYAVENGCDIHESCCEYAINNRHFECFIYAYEHSDDNGELDGCRLNDAADFCVYMIKKYLRKKIEI